MGHEDDLKDQVLDLRFKAVDTRFEALEKEIKEIKDGNARLRANAIKAVGLIAAWIFKEPLMKLWALLENMR